MQLSSYQSMKASGYTLIEILIALTIITMLFSLGFVGYRDFSRRQALQGAAKILQGSLRKAQQNAISGIKPAGIACDNPQTLNGYNFLVLTGGSEYQIQASCTGGTIITDDITLPGNLTISGLPSPNPILFKILGLGTNLTGGGTIVTIIQSPTNNSVSISVGSGGDIKQQ